MESAIHSAQPTLRENDPPLAAGAAIQRGLLKRWALPLDLPGRLRALLSHPTLQPKLLLVLKLDGSEGCRRCSLNRHGENIAIGADAVGVCRLGPELLIA